MLKSLEWRNVNSWLFNLSSQIELEDFHIITKFIINAYAFVIYI